MAASCCHVKTPLLKEEGFVQFQSTRSILLGNRDPGDSRHGGTVLARSTLACSFTWNVALPTYVCWNKGQYKAGQ